MSLDVASIASQSLRPPMEPAGLGVRAHAAEVSDTFAVSSSQIPPSPPPEVVEAMNAAARAARALHAAGRELRFIPPSQSGERRVRIEVRDLEGHILRIIPPSDMLDLATGAALD